MDKEKFVDESWKDSAQEQRDKLKDGGSQSSAAEGDPKEQEHQDPSETDAGSQGSFEVNFINYITSLGYQAMIFLGEIPNPVTNKTEKSLDQAKFLIDTLAMLKEKTKGNLSDQESNLLESSVYELQLKYVDTTQKEAKSDD